MFRGKSAIDAIIKDKGMKLINDKIEFWFNFHRSLDDGGEFYAGSITSLLINKREFLDPINANLPYMYMFHDREKRCMQIDKIQLFDPDDKLEETPIALFNSSYEYSSHYRDNEMINVVVLSSPIYFNNRIFRLKRIISLPDHSSSVIEEISLIDEDGFSEDTPEFSLSYYSHIHSKFSPLKRYDNQELNNCFIMCYDDSLPKNVYRFASNVSIEEKPEEKISCFSWRLSRAKKVVNSHLFKMIYPFNMEDFCEELLCKHLIMEEV